MTFSNSRHEILMFSSAIPAELTRYRIPGSQVSCASGEYGRLLLRELDSPSCPIHQTVYQAGKKSWFNIRDDGPFFFTCIALQHDWRMETKDLGAIHLKEGQFNIVYLPQFDLRSPYEGGKEYITLTLNYSIETLQEMAPWFPRLTAFLEKVQAGQPAILLEEHGRLTKEIQVTIYKILHCSPLTPSRRRSFDLLVNTLLFHLLLQSVQRQPASTYTHHEIDGIHAARDMICKNIRYHFIIREIARRVGMNEFKLKNGFRELFGNGVYEYLRTERMQEAGILLSDPGRSIKEVAALTGYKSVTSFIKAFKKKFHRTPGAFRKKT